MNATQQHICVWKLRMDTFESQEKLSSKDASQFSAADLYLLKNTSQSINSHIIRNFIKKCKLHLSDIMRKGCLVLFFCLPALLCCKASHACLLTRLCSILQAEI